MFAAQLKAGGAGPAHDYGKRACDADVAQQTRAGVAGLETPSPLPPSSDLIPLAT